MSVLPNAISVYERTSGAIALSYPPRVRVRAMVKLSAAFFHDESSITIGGVRKCNSAELATILSLLNMVVSTQWCLVDAQ